MKSSSQFQQLTINTVQERGINDVGADISSPKIKNSFFELLNFRDH